MSTNSICKLYAAAGVAILLLSGYLMHFVLGQLTNWLAADALIYVIVGAFLLVIGVVHLALAYAFCLGVLESIQGSRQSATLVREGTPIAADVKLQWQRPLYFGDDEHGKNAATYTLIICKWRPWICRTSEVRFDLSSEASYK